MTTEEALSSFLIISQWLSITPTDDDNLVSVRGTEGAGCWNQRQAMGCVRASSARTHSVQALAIFLEHLKLFL